MKRIGIDIPTCTKAADMPLTAVGHRPAYSIETWNPGAGDWVDFPDTPDDVADMVSLMHDALWATPVRLSEDGYPVFLIG